MNIIKSRSPYFISINQAFQIEGKIELYLWHKGQTEPTTPTHSLSKKIPSTTQKTLTWNISNYINEFIDIVNPVKVLVPTQENNNAWCFCKVKRYALLFFEGETEYSLLDTTTYVGVQGFTEYMDGVNDSVVGNYLELINSSIKVDYKYSATEIPYFNLMLERNLEFDWTLTYYNAAGTSLSTQTIITAGALEIFNYKIPLFINNPAYNVASLDIECEIIGTLTINVNKIEECKYTPVECAFINSSGGWQFLTFFKAQTNGINVKGSDYNLLPDSVDYNIYKGQSKVFNINGSQTVKLNTGWVAENYNELIHDLLLSETVLIDNKPAKVKTQSLTYKTQLKDKMINFELDFEYAFDLINNIV
jgi:hypothetical protein